MRSVGGKIAGSFGVALILLILIGILSFLNIQHLNTNIQWVIHTHLVIENLEGVLSLLTDAETGQRGFIITGQNKFLEPYNTANPQIAQRVQTLRDLTRDNPQQQQRLDQLTPLIQSRLQWACSGKTMPSNISCRTMGWVSTWPMSINFSNRSIACIPRTSSPAPASASRWCSASSSAMVAASGRKRWKARGRRSCSP